MGERSTSIADNGAAKDKSHKDKGDSLEQHTPNVTDPNTANTASQTATEKDEDKDEDKDNERAPLTEPAAGTIDVPSPNAPAPPSTTLAPTPALASTTSRATEHPATTSPPTASPTPSTPPPTTATLPTTIKPVATTPLDPSPSPIAAIDSSAPPASPPTRQTDLSTTPPISSPADIISAFNSAPTALAAITPAAIAIAATAIARPDPDTLTIPTPTQPPDSNPPPLATDESAWRLNRVSEWVHTTPAPDDTPRKAGYARIVEWVSATRQGAGAVGAGTEQEGDSEGDSEGEGEGEVRERVEGDALDAVYEDIFAAVGEAGQAEAGADHCAAITDTPIVTAPATVTATATDAVPTPTTPTPPLRHTPGTPDSQAPSPSRSTWPRYPRRARRSTISVASPLAAVTEECELADAHLGELTSAPAVASTPLTRPRAKSASYASSPSRYSQPSESSSARAPAHQRVPGSNVHTRTSLVSSHSASVTSAASVASSASFVCVTAAAVEKAYRERVQQRAATQQATGSATVNANKHAKSPSPDLDHAARATFIGRESQLTVGVGHPALAASHPARAQNGPRQGTLCPSDLEPNPQWALRDDLAGLHLDGDKGDEGDSDGEKADGEEDDRYTHVVVRRPSRGRRRGGVGSARSHDQGRRERVAHNRGTGARAKRSAAPSPSPAPSSSPPAPLHPAALRNVPLPTSSQHAGDDAAPAAASPVARPTPAELYYATEAASASASASASAFMARRRHAGETHDSLRCLQKDDTSWLRRRVSPPSSGSDSSSDGEPYVYPRRDPASPSPSPEPRVHPRRRRIGVPARLSPPPRSPRALLAPPRRRERERYPPLSRSVSPASLERSPSSPYCGHEGSSFHSSDLADTPSVHAFYASVDKPTPACHTSHTSDADEPIPTPPPRTHRRTEPITTHPSPRALPTLRLSRDAAWRLAGQAAHTAYTETAAVTVVTRVVVETHITVRPRHSTRYEEGEDEGVRVSGEELGALAARVARDAFELALIPPTDSVNGRRRGSGSASAHVNGTELTLPRRLPNPFMPAAYGSDRDERAIRLEDVGVHKGSNGANVNGDTLKGHGGGALRRGRGTMGTLRRLFRRASRED